MKQPTLWPTRKMSTVGASGILTGAIIWAARQYFNADISPEMASGIVVVVVSALGYLVPERDLKRKFIPEQSD